MRKKAGYAAVLLISLFWLGGCMRIWSGGPCYGFGCGADAVNGQKAPSGVSATITAPPKGRATSGPPISRGQ